VALGLTVTETLKGGRVIAIDARNHNGMRRKVLTVGSTSVTLAAGQTRTVRVALNRLGRKLLASRRHLKATMRVSQVRANRQLVTVSTQRLAFTASHRRRARTRSGQEVDGLF
jgi:hypothetical protein